MSDFINRLNRADRLAALFRNAEITALHFEELLLDEGFYNVEFTPPAAVYAGVKYELGYAALRQEVVL